MDLQPGDLIHESTVPMYTLGDLEHKATASLGCTLRSFKMLKLAGPNRPQVSMQSTHLCGHPVRGQGAGLGMSLILCPWSLPLLLSFQGLLMVFFFSQETKPTISSQVGTQSGTQPYPHRDECEKATLQFWRAATGPSQAPSHPARSKLISWERTPAHRTWAPPLPTGSGPQPE